MKFELEGQQLPVIRKKRSEIVLTMNKSSFLPKVLKMCVLSKSQNAQ